MSEPRATAHARIPARLLDLSLGGALLALNHALPIGSIHEFGVNLGAETVRLRAEVRHCRPADRYTGFHIGVRFLEIDPADEERLGEFLGSRW